MATNILPTSTGVQWWKSAWELFRRDPLSLVLPVLLGSIVCSLLALVPIVGLLAISALGPLYVVGMVNVCRDIENGRKFALDSFQHPAREKAAELAMLGLAAIFASVLVWLIGLAVAGSGMKMTFALAMGSHPPEGLNPNDLGWLLKSAFIFMLVCTVLAAPIWMAYWYSPFLIAFRNRPLLEALQTSFHITLKNWRAFVVNGLVFVLFWFAAGIALLIFFAIFNLILPARLATVLEFVVLIVATLIATPVMFANYYQTFKTEFDELSLSPP